MLDALAELGCPHHHQVFGIAVKHRTQQYGIHDTKDRRVGANAETQRQHCHCGGSAILEQHPKTVLKVS
ncbi:MAG TPA: hypothetical protein VNV82_20770 [Bryobacteraceae bacterium]|nr:hypothetical protein [Bryobacteraceae bacterium]